MVEFAADGRATRMLGTIQDITERKRTELEAAAQRAFRETLVESIPGVFYAIDTGGRFLLFNNNSNHREVREEDQTPIQIR